jgi:hypothetical protein
MTVMILEVSNAVDKGRMDFMKRRSPHQTFPQCANVNGLTVMSKSHPRFSINKYGGHHRPKATESFAPKLSWEGYIDNMINVISSDDRRKIIACNFSAGSPILITIICK